MTRLEGLFHSRGHFGLKKGHVSPPLTFQFIFGQCIYLLTFVLGPHNTMRCEGNAPVLNINKETKAQRREVTCPR